MAFKIDVPGIGEVTVDGAAEESTLKELVSLVDQMSKQVKKSATSTGGAQDAVNVQKALTAEQKRQQEQLKKNIAQGKVSQSEVDKLIAAYGDEEEAIRKVNQALKDQFLATKAAAVEVGTTMVAAISAVATGYNTAAKSPIEAGNSMLQGVEDIMASVTKLGIQLIAVGAEQIAGLASYLAPASVLAIDNLAKFGQDVVDFGMQIVTIGNNMLKQEFQKRADLFNNINSMGGSFAGGMSEMAANAMTAGVGINVFGDAIKEARPYFSSMGTTVGQATALVSTGLASMAKTTTKSGVSVRDSLFALGYSYDQQAVVLAQYMAQQKAFGVNLASIAPASLAEGTADYARNLKVLNDITGQNAAQLMQEARVQTQRSALLTQLNVQQKNSFQQAYATLAALPGQQAPVLQNALEQLLAGGTITDPIVAGNQQVMDMLQKTAAQIQNGNYDMVVNTQANLAEAAQAFRASGQSATDFATLMNPSGTSSVAQGMSALGNALNQYQYTAGAAEDSTIAAKGQATASDGLTSAYTGLQATMTGFQVTMEGIVGNYLPGYISGIEASTKVMINLGTTAAGIASGMAGAFGALIGIINKFLPGGATGGGDNPNLAQNKALIGSAADLLSGDISAVPTQGKPITYSGNDTTSTATTRVGPTEAIPSAADGGILTGDTSGFAATLHGTEAVVPLPDNRSIPVSLDSSSLNAALNQQSGLLNQILDAMNKNNRYTSGILQNSM